jgi:hypothetical protein
MAKTTPLRLSDTLLREAKQKGARTHRSAAAQIEHWAMVGKAIEGDLTDAQVEAVSAGLARVLVVADQAADLPELDDVLTDLQDQRGRGDLAAFVAGPVRYRAARDGSGSIEEVTPHGVRRGRFTDGAFRPDQR